MSYLIRIATFGLVLAFASGVEADKNDKHSARFGDLLISATALEDIGPAPIQLARDDRHRIHVFVTFKNLGKQAICTQFTARLKASYGLSYNASGLFSQAPRAEELLPNIESAGPYEFEVTPGAQPLELVLKPGRKKTGCGPSARESAELPSEVALDVHDLPPPKSTLPAEKVATSLRTTGWLLSWVLTAAIAFWLSKFRPYKLFVFLAIAAIYWGSIFMAPAADRSGIVAWGLLWTVGLPAWWMFRRRGASGPE